MVVLVDMLILVAISKSKTMHSSSSVFVEVLSLLWIISPVVVVMWLMVVEVRLISVEVRLVVVVVLLVEVVRPYDLVVEEQL